MKKKERENVLSISFDDGDNNAEISIVRYGEKVEEYASIDSEHKSAYMNALYYFAKFVEKFCDKR